MERQARGGTLKNVIALSDFHCGHLFGLTPPEWQVGGAIGQSEEMIYRFFKSAVARAGHADVLLLVGDAIDGNGRKSGGTELITTDRLEQCRIAARCIEDIGAEKVVIIHGTGYHTGDYEDWEDVLGELVGAEIVGGHEMLDIGGVIFDAKHHISSTKAPYHQYTPMAREVIDAMKRHHTYGEPMPDIIIRGHTHHYDELLMDGVRVFKLPAWEWHTKFGSRVCGGVVSIGLVSFKCEGGTYTWEPDLMDMRGLIKPPMVL
jgi:hypothetical protein